MEQEEINIAALLKDCPKGTRLYSPICGECEYSHQDETLISVIAKGRELSFTFYGELYEYLNSQSECLLFPSKEVRSWRYFNVKYAKGVGGKGEEIKALLESNGGIDKCGYDFGSGQYIYYIDRIDNHIKAVFLQASAENTSAYAFSNFILSTGTELKLEEEQPKFKVGDVVKERSSKLLKMLIKSGHEWYEKANYNKYLAVCSEANEFADTFTLATLEEIAKWNDEKLHPNHMHYSKSKRKIIHWFLPFDKVVVRTSNCEWEGDFYCYYNSRANTQPYRCVGCIWEECLPYNEKTAKLIGTTDEYNEDE